MAGGIDFIGAVLYKHEKIVQIYTLNQYVQTMTRYVLYICVKQKPYDEEYVKEKQDNQNEVLHWCETYCIQMRFILTISTHFQMSLSRLCSRVIKELMFSKFCLHRCISKLTEITFSWLRVNASQSNAFGGFFEQPYSLYLILWEKTNISMKKTHFCFKNFVTKKTS